MQWSVHMLVQHMGLYNKITNQDRGVIQKEQSESGNKYRRSARGTNLRLDVVSCVESLIL
jgi:hypothetical protein